jgi:hypothetical protein
MSKKLLTALAGLMVCALPSTAAIQGFFATLSGSYVVPTGKVLVLQAVVPPSNDLAANILQMLPAGGGVTLQLRINAYATNGLYAFPVAMNLPAGTTLTGSGTGLFGLLVDPQDLYVGIKSTLANPAYASGTFSGVVELASAAPPDIRFQTSSNFANWEYDSTIALQPTSIKTNVQFSALAKGPERFYRTTVRRR